MGRRMTALCPFISTNNGRTSEISSESSCFGPTLNRGSGLEVGVVKGDGRRGH